MIEHAARAAASSQRDWQDWLAIFIQGPGAALFAFLGLYTMYRIGQRGEKDRRRDDRSEHLIDTVLESVRTINNSFLVPTGEDELEKRVREFALSLQLLAAHEHSRDKRLGDWLAGYAELLWSDTYKGNKTRASLVGTVTGGVLHGCTKLLAVNFDVDRWWREYGKDRPATDPDL